MRRSIASSPRSHEPYRKGLGGALGEIRTPDPRIRSPMLYPAELRAREGSITRLGRAGPAASVSRRSKPARCASRRVRTDAISLSNATRSRGTSVLSAIGRRTLRAKVGRRTVVIREGAGHDAGPIIVIVADRVGERRRRACVGALGPGSGSRPARPEWRRRKLSFSPVIGASGRKRAHFRPIGVPIQRENRRKSCGKFATGGGFLVRPACLTKFQHSPARVAPSGPP